MTIFNNSDLNKNNSIDIGDLSILYRELFPN